MFRTTPCWTDNIGLIKAGQAAFARPVLERVVNCLLEMGARSVILGCTELSAILSNMDQTIDPTRELAKHCVKRFLEKHSGRAASYENQRPNSTDRKYSGLIGA